MGSRKIDAADFHSARDQTDAIRGEAARRGIDVEFLPAELDVSGGLPLDKRPSLSQAVAGVRSGKYAGVIAAYLSRFGRDLEGGLMAWRLIEEAGGQVIIVAENIDSSTVNGRFMRGNYLNIATMEREQHQERFANLRGWATDAGIWQRRQTPRGYSKDQRTRKLVPNSQADEVRAAFRARPAGRPVIALARDLEMTPAGVRALLKNRVYLGELRVGDHVNAAAHPALVSLDEFEAAQSSVARPPRGQRKDPALLAGIVRCAGCGHKMTRGGTTANPQYGCCVQHSGERCPAPASVTARNLDAHVETIARPELARLRVQSTAGHSSKDAEAAVRDAERELTGYLSAVSVNDIGAQAFSAGARARKETLDAAKTELRAKLALQPALSRTVGPVVYDEFDVTERNTVLRGLLATVVVERSGGRGIIRPLKDRVRVLKNGAPISLPGKGDGSATGLHPIIFDELDAMYVLDATSATCRSSPSDEGVA